MLPKFKKGDLIKEKYAKYPLKVIDYHETINQYQIFSFKLDKIRFFEKKRVEKYCRRIKASDSILKVLYGKI